MTVKVAFMQLSSCWGCHQSLVNAHLGLLSVLPSLEIVYWPAVVDFKHDSLVARENGEIVVGFIEGMIRTKQDLENTKLIREKSQLIIAFGSCACYGNVPGLANQWPIEEVQSRKFMEVESATTKRIPDQFVPGFENKVVNVDDIIKVDAYISGCPPRTEQIVGSILFLLGQKGFPMNEKAFCEDCVLKESGCLLDKDILCYGPVTSIGCSLKCTSKGDPCVGCMGPAKVVSNKASKLLEMTKSLEPISIGDKKNLYEFLSLFLNVPLMAGFDLSGDILKQVKKRGKPEMPLTNMSSITMEIATNLLGFLAKHPEFHEISNVCQTCPRIIGNNTMTEVKRDYQGLPNEKDCFIEQGYICVGPITKAGCGGLCIKVNAPCTGCFGQTEWVTDQATRYFETISKNFNVDLTKEEFLAQVKDPIGTFNKFTLASNRGFNRGEL
jgi:F420-non-reducing hydrogenase small subunit